MIRLIKTIICIVVIALMSVLLVYAYETEYEEAEYEEDEQQGTSSPSRVIIIDYSIHGDGLAAGEVSTGIFVLKNTSAAAYVSSVLLTGWIETSAPVHFTGTNQAYIGRIPPGGTVNVAFEYYSENIDMAAISSINAGFAIHYADEATGIERANNVTLRLPVLREGRPPLYPEQLTWQTRELSRLDSLLYSRTMQTVYLGTIIFCAIWIILLMLFKFGILKRKF